MNFDVDSEKNPKIRSIRVKDVVAVVVKTEEMEVEVGVI